MNYWLEWVFIIEEYRENMRHCGSRINPTGNGYYMIEVKPV